MYAISYSQPKSQEILIYVDCTNNVKCCFTPFAMVYCTILLFAIRSFLRDFRYKNPRCTSLLSRRLCWSCAADTGIHIIFAARWRHFSNNDDISMAQHVKRVDFRIPNQSYQFSVFTDTSKSQLLDKRAQSAHEIGFSAITLVRRTLTKLPTFYRRQHVSINAFRNALLMAYNTCPMPFNTDF